MGQNLGDVEKLPEIQVGLLNVEQNTEINHLISHFNSAWEAYTPTYTYTGTGPVVEVKIGRFKRIGKTIHFYTHSTMSDTGVSASALTISLPVTPLETGTYMPCTAIEKVVTTYTDPAAYIDMTTDAAAARLIKFRNFSAMATGANGMEVSGTYEIA